MISAERVRKITLENIDIESLYKYYKTDIDEIEDQICKLALRGVWHYSVKKDIISCFLMDYFIALGYHCYLTSDGYMHIDWS